MNVLVTGGNGYIGSHTCIELLNAGHQVIVVDNLCNSKISVLERVQKISGQPVQFYNLDVRDKAALSAVFEQHKIDAVIHFAGLKAVGESVSMPLEYYNNNVYSTLILAEVMHEHKVYNLVFSSSATVYGDPASVPIRENFPLSATNPYGRSKLILEEILRDLPVANPAWHITLLRYFNPVGAHSSGLIGEDPNGIPNNLMPYVSQVAAGKLAQLSVFGGDYPTPDGTGVRDYIHVVDLALGHVQAINNIEKQAGVSTYNIGTGHGYSVLDMVKAFELASGKKVPYKIVGRRAGDIASCYADAGLAERELQWRAQRDINAMCEDTWHWQTTGALTS